MALSDIHIDINSKRKDPQFAKKLISYLDTIEGDVLVLTGDIAGDTQQVINFLEQSQELNYAYKLFVPGNHDVWVNQQSEDLSYVKYYEILPEVVTNFGWEYIPNNPIVIDGTAFLGTMGWYDYSSRNTVWDDKFPLKYYRNKIHPQANLELMDRHYVRFGKPDEDMATEFNQDLLDDFDYVTRRFPPSEIDNVVVMTHMVPFRDFIWYRGVYKYDYFTAFFGNFKLGDIIMEKSKTHNIHAIFGQTHMPKVKRLSKTLKGYCVPIGYPREYGKMTKLQNLFDRRVLQIDL